MYDSESRRKQPLHGVRVIELATGVAGCYVGKLLADLGADVVKVEPPDGDIVRRWGPFPGEDPAVEVREQGALHLHLNTNKRSVVVDLGADDDRALVAALASDADIVIESFTPGRLDALGLGWNTLRSANPALVLTSISPFGQDGPYAAYRGSEIVSYAMGGPMHATGVAERAPVKLAGQLISYQCGAIAAVATLGALLMAEESGVGSHVDVANFETQAGSIDRRMVFLQQYVYNGRIMARSPSGAQGLLPTSIYPTADGWAMVSTPPPWAGRMQATIQSPELDAILADPNWAADPDVPGMVEAVLYEWLSERTGTQAMRDAEPQHWPVTPVRSPREVLADPQFTERNFFVPVDHPVAGSVLQPRGPFRMADGWMLHRPAPTLGQHDAEIRAEVGKADRTQRVDHPATDSSNSPDQLPLAGTRVLDMTMVWAGPYTTTLLGDLGADIVRVEDSVDYVVSRGAVARPPKEILDTLGWMNAYPDDEPGDRPWNRSAFFNIHARNKRSATVDLRQAEGVELFLRLIEKIDVMVENNSAGVIDKLGIGWDVLHRRNPRLILLRMPALGLTGPSSSVAGFGANFEALCGLTALRGYPDADRSDTTPVYYMDTASGAAGAVAALAALRRRERTGVGEMIELAQGENMLNLIGEYLVDAGRTDRQWDPAGNRHLTDAPQGAYRCQGEDRWVVLSVDSDDAWLALIDAMGNPSWSTDERFSTAGGRRAHHDELDQRLEEWTSTLDRWEVTRRCQEAGVIAGPVLDEPDAVTDPHLRARGFFRPRGSEEVGWHDYPGHLWKWSGPPMLWDGLCPYGGANEAVWQDLVGLTDEEYDRLRRAGHFRDHFVDAAGNPL
ncbi:MAG: CoA transferase [Actinomycetota bacterium]|nr:CoA transferase [Actinomycetota bacterium]